MGMRIRAGDIISYHGRLARVLRRVPSHMTKNSYYPEPVYTAPKDVLLVRWFDRDSVSTLFPSWCTIVGISSATICCGLMQASCIASALCMYPAGHMGKCVAILPLEARALQYAHPTVGVETLLSLQYS